MTEPTIILRTDPGREFDGDQGVTGIYVRAQRSDGRWGNADIAELDKESLDIWLRSRQSIEWPIGVVMILLDHQR